MNCKTRLEEAADAIKELNQMIVEAKEEYSKLADEKNFKESINEAKITEKGIKLVYCKKNNLLLLR